MRLTRKTRKLTIGTEIGIDPGKLMKPAIARTILLTLLTFTLVIGVAGCGTPKPKPVAWTVKITKPAAVEVDIVAVTTREKPRLENYSMDKYWSPDDLERRNAVKLTSPSQSAEWIVDRKDPNWKKWLAQGVTGFHVIANLPGNFEPPDARREYLTLNKHFWEAKKSTLEIDVQENRIVVLTPEKQ
jgi:hypothetical protein